MQGKGGHQQRVWQDQVAHATHVDGLRQHGLCHFRRHCCGQGLWLHCRPVSRLCWCVQVEQALRGCGCPQGCFSMHHQPF